MSFEWPTKHKMVRIHYSLVVKVLRALIGLNGPYQIHPWSPQLLPTGLGVLLVTAWARPQESQSPAWPALLSQISPSIALEYLILKMICRSCFTQRHWVPFNIKVQCQANYFIWTRWNFLNNSMSCHCFTESSLLRAYTRKLNYTAAEK